jgi:hypothetical protein
LLWTARGRSPWQQAIVFLAAGTISMWIQPLVAVHVLAAGVALTVLKLAEGWNLERRTLITVLAVSLILSAVVVVFHPAFRVMRAISGNDGYLVFGYSHVMLVAILCGAAGAFNLYRRFTGRAEYVDAVLGCAVLAGVGLVVLQFAALKLHGDGSAYAVKKHMFLVLTLGLINLVRAIVGFGPVIKDTSHVRLLAPIAAGMMSFFILRAFNWPVAPVVNAMSYAEQAARFNLPDFAAGNTVDDTSPLLLSNVITSLTSFEHPFDAQAIGWLQGKKIRDGAKFVMVPRTPEIDKNCGERFAENQQFVIVSAACLHAN